MPEVIDAHYTTEPRRLRLIWADRMAIAAAMIVGALLWVLFRSCQSNIDSGLVGYTAGSCGSFLSTVMTLTVYVLIGVGFVGRVIDFVICGRIR